MGTLVRKWGPFGDPKTEKGPHGDPLGSSASGAQVFIWCLVLESHYGQRGGTGQIPPVVALSVENVQVWIWNIYFIGTHT